LVQRTDNDRQSQVPIPLYHQPSRHNASNSNSNVTCSALRASSQHIVQTLSHATPQQTVPRHLLSITPRQLSLETLIRRCSLTIGDFTLVEIPRIAHITAHAKERCRHAWIQLANRFSQQCNDLCTRAPTIIVSYDVGSVHSVTVKDTLSYPRRLHPTACGPPTPSSPFKQSAVHVLTLCHLRPKQTNYCASSISNNLTSGRYELTTCFTL
jgi:hypothetical protein